MKISKLLIKNKIFYSVVITAMFLAGFSVALASDVNKENIIYLLNQSRLENGENPLKENQKLNEAAQEKLDNMIEKKYFAHTSPSGITPWYWFEKNGYEYQYAGENLALGFSSAEKEHQAWMDSPTHRKNILNPSYKEIGVAVGRGVIDEDMVTVAVQMFGSRFENSNGVKEESNISDDKSKEMLEENKKENEGVVLNTESSGSNNNGGNLNKNNPAAPKISFKETMLHDREFLNNSIWMTATLILSIFVIFNILVALVLIFHGLVNHLRKNRDAFTVAHSILILWLVGSIIF